MPASSGDLIYGEVNILGLHECIFREIFNYLDHHVLYFTIRSVCQLLRKYVDSYIELGGKFILCPRSPSTPIEILYIFKKQSMPVSSCSKLMPHLPYPAPYHPRKLINKPIHYLRTFGAMIKGNLIIGVYYRREKLCRYFFWRFDQDEQEWIPIQTDSKIEPSYWDDKMVQRLPMASCAFDNTLLILEHLEYAMPNKLIPYRNYNEIRRFEFYASSNLKTESNKRLDYESLESERLLSRYNSSGLELGNGNNDNLNKLIGTNMTQIEDKKFLLFGVVRNRIGNTSVPMLSNLFYSKKDNTPHGERNWKIDYDTLPLSNSLISYKRRIMFKLKNNIFIGGGTRAFSHCHFSTDIQALQVKRINIDDGTCNDTSYTLPYHVDSNDGNPIVDEQETFALISRECLGRTLIFTEKDGFYELPNTNYDETWKNYHLKDREKEVLPKIPLLRIE